MTEILSLHTVQIIIPPGDSLNYDRLREEVRKYRPNLEMSSDCFYILSSDCYNSIKHKLNYFLPEIPCNYEPHKQVAFQEYAVKGILIQQAPKPSVSPGRRLHVIRVYHPANSEIANPEMRAIYEKLLSET